ncbi:MAG TPA: TRAP transporter small permease [Advenella sp.]|nr:TRAP transporter small permease [Advenella sp.]
MKKKILAIESALVRIEGAVVFTVLVMLLVTLALQVISRFLFEFPIAWTEELARALQIWLVFVGAAIGMHRAEHFVVEIFMQRCNFPGKQVVARMIDVLVVAFFCVLAWNAAQVTLHGSSQTMPALGVSVAWSYSAIPLGCALMAFHFAMAWIRPLDPNRDQQEAEMIKGVAE